LEPNAEECKKHDHITTKDGRVIHLIVNDDVEMPMTDEEWNRKQA